MFLFRQAQEANQNSMLSGRAIWRNKLRRRLSIRNIISFLRAVLLKAVSNNISGGPFLLEQGADIRIHARAKVRIGREVCFKRNFSGSFQGEVVIGDRVWFNRNCYIAVHNRLEIGDDCIFGEMVSIHDENHILGPGPQPIASRGYRTAPIKIGRNVWVGAKATILPGVTIGDNAVVAANAVVTSDVPSLTIVAGIPARIIKEL